MFILDNTGRIKVSQGDSFILNVISNKPLYEGDTVTFTVKDELDTTKTVIEKVVDKFNKVKICDVNKNSCGCSSNGNQINKDSQYVDMVTFVFESLDTAKEPGNYYYDIQFDFKKHNIRYTAMKPTKFIIVEDVTNNIYEMGDIVMPPIIENPESEEDEDEQP